MTSRHWSRTSVINLNVDDIVSDVLRNSDSYIIRIWSVTYVCENRSRLGSLWGKWIQAIIKQFCYKMDSSVFVWVAILNQW